jgi:helix-turn-helix protein
VLREHRGDGHVAALLTAGLDPVETLVLFVADNAMDAGWLRKRRGWSDEEWSAASARLAERGLLDAAGDAAAPTAAGRTLRAEVEGHTDALADVPWAVIGAARAERLVELVGPLVRAIVAGGGFLPGNPMGLRPLVAS